MLNKPIDDYCHILDALRYGMEDIRDGIGVKKLNRDRYGI